MTTPKFEAIRSISKAVRDMISYYREVNFATPSEIQVHPVIHDAWKAELLVTGKIMPGQRLMWFDNIRVRVVMTVDTCYLV